MQAVAVVHIYTSAYRRYPFDVYACLIRENEYESIINWLDMPIILTVVQHMIGF